MNLSQKVADILTEYNEQHPFSGAVLLRENENILERSYGYANRSEEIINTTHTGFGIASGCKIFTAVAVCQLVEAGILSFDSYLKDCVASSFPHFDPGITVHHLLTHTSGIPDYFDEEVMDDFEQLWETLPMYKVQSPADFLPLFQDKPMKSLPGEAFSYNNAGFILLGLIIEQVTGMTFTAYVEKNIFQRCEMLDSGYFRMDQLPKNTALGYIDEEAGWRTNLYSLPIIGGPDGGAFTTVFDMAKFWDALFGHRILSEKMTNLMLTPHSSESEQLRYGYGLWISMKSNHVFKYFVMGSDPGVTMQSSVYAGQPIQAHVIGNISRGAGILTGKIDELIYQAQLGESVYDH
ncbi:serine hydrolase domain-containing protein [Paenibacillus puldeungensis]|uniref:Serine hydrolase domain-containing protein n=1 Tax=Paenibacillus puldeungensis TaxID=696536 RepID=A0ABW3S1I2_9BACL